MIKRKFVHSIITLFIFLLFSFQIVFAGTHSTHYVTSWWSFGNNWSYYYTQQGTVNYSSNISTAISSWKAASSKLNISKATAPYGNIVITSKNYGNTGWDAMTYINLRIEIQDNVTSSNRSELVAHELGHGFGLGHYSCSSEFMRAVGYKGSASPYEGDIAGINSLY